MKEHMPPAETDDSPEETFNASFDKLWKMPDREDDGYLRVRSKESMPHLPESLKVITARTRGGAYKVGISLSERSAGVPTRTITVDVMDYNENMATVTFVPHADPLGNREVSATVDAPPVTALTKADQQFLSAIGMQDLVEQADIPTSDSRSDYQVTGSLAESQQLATVGNLPQIVTAYPL